MSNAVLRPSKVFGCIKAPSSKSIAHRLIICASLAKGVSTIKDVDISDDIVATISSLRSLGAKIDIIENKKTTKVVVKKPIDFETEDIYLNAYSSATTLRLLLPLVSMCTHIAHIKMNNDLFKRPNDIYDQIFGSQLKKKDNTYILNANLKSGEYNINGNISSQFISGLLLALPLLNEDSHIHVIQPFSSSSYVYLTIDAMKKAGVEIIKESDFDFYIKGCQTYQVINENVEGDYSNAANIFALGALYGEVSLSGLNKNSIQNDIRIIDILTEMGVSITNDNNSITVKKSKLKPINLDLDNNIDIAPLLISLCAVTNGTSYIYNVHRLRYKESDRIDSLLNELSKLDCYIENKDDNLKIIGGSNIDGGFLLDSHNDHRICMALSVIAGMFKYGLTIKNIECVNKSYPCFFDDLKALGIDVKIEE